MVNEGRDGMATKTQTLKHWTATYEVEHYVNHDSYIDTVTNEARLGRHLDEKKARQEFWQGIAEGVTPNGILMVNVKSIRILHLDGEE